MKLFGKDLDRDVVIVAEIGVNHEGDYEAARRLIELAEEAGADAVKFQTYSPERFVSADDPDRLERVRRFCLSEADIRSLSVHAADLGVGFFSSAISEDVVPLLAELGPAIKIASGDVTFEPVVRAAAGTGRVVILSTGAANEAEIDQAVDWVRDTVGETAMSERLILLHCVSAYPTPIDQANLRSIPYLADRYRPVRVGYSNHVMGAEAVIAAVALGANLVEVHFTDRKEGRSFRDHTLSADPNDLCYLVETLPQIAAARGVFGKAPQPCEQETIAAIRKGVTAARDIPAGTILRLEDLAFARPGTEIACGDVGHAVGKTLMEPVSAGTLIRRQMLSERQGI